MMNEQAAREVLARLADAPVALWRGDSLAGHDVDLLVTGDWEGALRAASLAPRPDGHWVTPGGDVVVDPLPARDWPRHYPPADGVIARAERRDPELPPVAAADDRLAIFAADAVAGRSVAKLAAKMRAALAEEPDAEPVLAPADLERWARRDALPMLRALGVVARMPRARHALLARARAGGRRRLGQKKR
jgi:hypothetical protein